MAEVDLQWLNNGALTVTHSAFDIGQISAVFDKNTTSLARSAAINPMVLTLSFQQPQHLVSVGVYFYGGDNRFSVESADTMADLDGKQGSYRSLISSLDGSEARWLQADVGGVQASFLRVSLRRLTGDNYVHLNELRIVVESDAPSALGNALEAPSLAWTTGGSAPWFNQAGTTHDGVDAARSGGAGDNGESWLETTIVGPGNLSFWWRASCEADWDILHFLVDGFEETYLTGITPWQSHDAFISPGPHQVRWVYVKDWNGSDGEDCGWLDEVRFDSFVIPPIIVRSPSDQVIDAGDQAVFAIEALPGSGPFLTYQWFANGTPVGGNEPVLTLTAIQPSQAGTYQVVVSGDDGGSTTASAQLTVVPAADFTTGLLAYFPFDSDFADHVGGRTVTPVGNPLLASGHLGDALLLDGHSYLQVEDPQLLNGASEATVTTWIRPRYDAAAQSEQTILASGDPVFNSDIFQMRLAAGNPYSMGWFMFGTVAPAGEDWFGTQFIPDADRVSFLDDRWQLVAMVVRREGTGARFQVYNNGILALETTRDTPFGIGFDRPGSTLTTWIGALRGTAQWYGMIDDLRIYNRPLSAARLAQLVTATAPTFTQHPTNASAKPGADVRLAATAVGTEPLHYQWQFQGVDIPGATGPTLLLPNVQTSSSGTYGVRVTNAFGSATSRTAQLIVDKSVRVVVWGSPAHDRLKVPDDLTNAVAVALGYSHCLALRQNGTVTTWGTGYGAPLTPPLGLSNVSAIAAGAFFSLALLSNHTVVAWGSGRAIEIPQHATNVIDIKATDSHSLLLLTNGQVLDLGEAFVDDNHLPYLFQPPSGLNDVVTIAAGSMRSSAIQTDGTVSSWGWYIDPDWPYYSPWRVDWPGGVTNGLAVACGVRDTLVLHRDGKVSQFVSGGDATEPTPELTDVVAIAAGREHSLALRRDGTVVAWGRNTSGQTNVPAGLAQVSAIAAGETHSVALKADGTVVSWGKWDGNKMVTPVGLQGVTSVVAWGDLCAALTTEGLPPSIQSQPTNLVVTAGNSASLIVSAGGTGPFSFQWQRSGTNLAGSGGSSHVIVNAQPGDSGEYFVTIRNDWGTATSQVARVTVQALPLTRVLALAGGGWSSGGASAWFGQSGASLFGVPCAQSGSIGPGDESWLELPLAGPADLTFDWAMSGDAFDCSFGFSLDGVPMFGFGGGAGTGWSSGSLALPPGMHSGRWGFSKGSGAGAGFAAGFLANVGLTPGQLPGFDMSPIDQNGAPGETAEFSVSPTGSQPMNIQWQKDGIDIPGAIGSRLSLSNLTPAMSGLYRAIASNRFGSTPSAGARLTVRVPNTAPTIGHLEDRTVDEGETVTADIAATDPEAPPQVLSFRLSGGPPAAWISPTNGFLQWVTDEADGPSTNRIGVVVTDDGAPAISTTNWFTVIVREVNRPPVLAAVQDRSLKEGETFTQPMSASDPDIPANILNYSLGPGTPRGLSIDSALGLIQWGPGETAGWTSNRVTVILSDNGVPPLSATQQFTVFVKDTLRDFALRVASTNLYPGERTRVALLLDAAPEVTAVSFSLSLPSETLSDLVCTKEVPEVTWMSFQSTQDGLYQAEFRFDPDRQRAGATAIASLWFTALSKEHSVIVPLHLHNLAGTVDGGRFLTNATAFDGYVVLVAREPVLLLERGAGWYGTMYGHIGRQFGVEVTTALTGSPSWQPFYTGTLQDRFVTLALDASSAQVLLYRAYELPQAVALQLETPWRRLISVNAMEVLRLSPRDLRLLRSESAARSGTQSDQSTTSPLDQ